MDSSSSGLKRTYLFTNSPTFSFSVCESLACAMCSVGFASADVMPKNSMAAYTT